MQEITPIEALRELYNACELFGGPNGRRMQTYRAFAALRTANGQTCTPEILEELRNLSDKVKGFRYQKGGEVFRSKYWLEILSMADSAMSEHRQAPSRRRKDNLS
jgi:hypothetical protein